MTTRSGLVAKKWSFPSKNSDDIGFQSSHTFFCSKNFTFTVYVVSKDYAVKPCKEPTIFSLNKDSITSKGVKIYFANAKQIAENQYTSVSNSRLFAILSTDTSLEKAKEKVYNAMDGEIDPILDYRNDIGQIYTH